MRMRNLKEFLFFSFFFFFFCRNNLFRIHVGNSLTPGFDRTAATIKMPSAVLKPLNQESIDMLEYPFLTLTKYPSGFIIHLGELKKKREKICNRKIKFFK